MSQKTISILGLGWLGLPLAKALLDKGYVVKGSVTSTEKASELKGTGIDISIVKLYADQLEYTDAEFFSADVLIINFPPRRVNQIESIYPNQVGQLIPFILLSKVGKVIFISSTSVYPEVNRTVMEDDLLDPDKPSGIACLRAENELRQSDRFATTVIRFGGLIGADRNPHRFMKRGIKNGQAKVPVNLIHLDDCIGIIDHVIEQNIWGEVINGCCPEHPTREEFYTKAATVTGVEPPYFDLSSEFQFKKVSSEKLTNQLGYTFKYESPLNCI